VKVTIMFRGREMAHTELGRKLLDRLTEDLKELATVDAYPKLDGRNMVMVVAPIRRPATKATQPAQAAEGAGPAEGANGEAAATAPAADEATSSEPATVGERVRESES
jgi:translation initiation factor IF-3